jgi:MFS family permease
VASTTNASANSTRAPASLITFYALGYVGAYVALITPVATTLALKVADLDPDGKAASLGLISAVGAFFALVTNPLAGALSDRTTSRFGRRRPFIVGGTIGGVIGLAVVGFAPTIPVALVGWIIAQVSFNLVLAALQALLPDQIPFEQRAKVSAVLGISQQVSPLIGIGIATGVIASGAGFGLVFLVPGLVGAALLALLVVKLPDRQLETAVERFSLLEFVRGFRPTPGRAADFGWTFFGRFFVILGFAIYTTYQVYFITDRLGVPASGVTIVQLVAVLIFSIVLTVSAVISGRFSDRWHRRKIFVYIAVAVVGVGMVMLSLTTTVELFYLAAAVMGVGIGAFFAVDLALVTDVLPDQEHAAAKDLGIFNIANTLPQSVAPAIAPIILAIGGGTGNYTVLFLVAAGLALVGAAFIVPIKAVR